MTVDPTGHLELVIPADADGSTTENWYWKQTGGPLFVPGPTNGNGTGNQTFVPTPTVTVPEVPWLPGLVLVGGAVVLLARRRPARGGRARRATLTGGTRQG